VFDRAYQVLGYKSDAGLVGHGLVSEFVSENGTAAMQKLLEKGLDGQATGNVGVQLMNKDGVLISVVVDVLPERAQSNEAHVMVRESCPLSDMNQLTEWLGGVAAWMTEGNGEVMSCSAQGALELGYDAEEVVQSHCWEI
jgi:ribosome modulation factor